MRKAICDFCHTNEPEEAVLPINVTTPKGWLEWKITTGFGAHIRGQSKLMCPLCCESRNIDVKPYSNPTLSDILLDELHDGIRDIVSDEVGDLQR